MGNAIKPGPSTKRKRSAAFSVGGETALVYAEGNVLADGDALILNDWGRIVRKPPANIPSRPYPAEATAAEPAGGRGGDGMPDARETEHGFDPDDPAPTSTRTVTATRTPGNG